MVGCHHKTTDWAHSPFKTMLEKIRDQYKSYCTTYKTHAVTTCHGGAGHAGEDRDSNSHVEDTRNIDDNESTNSSETIIAFEGSDGHLSDLLPNSQGDLKILEREIHSLQQCIKAGEGQPAEGLDCIDHLEQELQTLSLRLSMQPTSTPIPTEPFGEVVCQYIDTLCTAQRQTTLPNSYYRTLPSSVSTIPQNEKNG